MRRAPPALIALGIQLVAALVVAGAAGLTGHFPTNKTGLLAASLLQGSLACGLSQLAGLAPWWLAIQLGFLPTVVGLQPLNLPPGVFLGGFLVLLGVYWSAFRTQVPLYLSGASVWRSVAAALPPSGGFRFIDLGSGLGGLLAYLARTCSRGEYAGIEIAPLPWIMSRLRVAFSRHPCRIDLGDYRRLDFRNYDVVFAYLSPAAMPDLWRKARAEMRPGSLLLSCEFQVPGARPDLAVALPGRRARTLYGWRM